MTLFENSGIDWPDLEKETRKTGGNVLNAISELFSVFASIEMGDSSFRDLSHIEESLANAGYSYALVAKQLSEEFADSLSPSELELASLPIQRLPYDDPLFALFLNTPRVSMHQLYFELSQRTARLRTAIRVFNPNLEATDLAPQVFQMMSLLDSMIIIARVIAVIGRRQSRFIPRTSTNPNFNDR